MYFFELSTKKVKHLMEIIVLYDLWIQFWALDPWNASMYATSLCIRTQLDAWEAVS